MADNSMNSQSDPADFNSDEVEEYLKTADDDEKRRVAEAEKNGKNRKGVLKAAEVEENSGDGSDGDDSNGNGGDAVGPAEGDVRSTVPPVDEQVEEAKGTAGDPESDDYVPYLDPAVTSSFVADVIASELA